MNKCRIKVVSGSCVGTSKVFPVFPGDTVSVGRSQHSNNKIVVSELDVSARHCMVRMDPDGAVWLEILSNKLTEVDGVALKSDGTTPLQVPLQPGQKIRLGRNFAFVLEQDEGDDMPTTMAPSQKTSVTMSGGADDIPTTTTPRPSRPAAPGNADDMPTSAKLWSPSTENLDDSAYRFPPKTAPGSADDMPTSAKLPPPQAATGSAFETAMATSPGTDSVTPTILASPEEIGMVKKKIQSKRTMKNVSIGAAVLLFLCVSGAFYSWLRPDPEGPVVWPARLNDSNAAISLEFKNTVCFVFPSTTDYKAYEDSVVVRTAFGAKRDIPVFIYAKSWDDPDGLEIGRKEAFRRYRNKLQEEDASLDFDPYENFIFVNVKQKYSAGVPLDYVSYTRRVGDEDYFGYMVFFRYQTLNIAYQVEVPKATQWKTDYFLREVLSQMVLVSDAITLSHWEGSSGYRRTTTAKADLDEARPLLNSPGEWAHCFYCIRSALIKSCRNKDEETLTSAKSLLGTLRQRQAEWFNGQRLLYQSIPDEDMKRLQSIQSDCEAAFPVDVQDTDYRYDLIKRKAWK